MPIHLSHAFAHLQAPRMLRVFRMGEALVEYTADGMRYVMVLPGDAVTGARWA